MTTLRPLLLDTRDGEWGKGEPAEGRVEMHVIRGTDFAAVREGQTDGVPVRYLEQRHADRKRLQPWDIVFETAGGSPDRPTGRSILMTPRAFELLGDEVTCASFARFLRVDPKQADPAFVFWMLQHHYECRDLLQYHTQHTGVARFQFTTFSNTFDFDLPPLDTQRRIASILGAYDDLIEVNRRRVAVLEEMARGLFEEWFVRFRFPGHESVPLVATPDGPLPQGWSRNIVEEVTSFINRGIAPKYSDDSETLVVNQKCIRDGRLNLALARRQTKTPPAAKLVQVGDVLINSTGVGTLGRVAQAEEVPQGLTVDSHVTIVRPACQDDRDYLGLLLLSMQQTFEHLGAGSTGQTELSRQAVGAQVVPWAPKGLRTSFGAAVRPMRALVVKLIRQNERLAESRDLLLPRLLSGQLSVEAAERDLELAA
ncbi:MAG: restriction endonuclease subunit S [Bordetella sp.]|nr:restriction endonuclease subunit S [Bordetella sp.]